MKKEAEGIHGRDAQWCAILEANHVGKLVSPLYLP